MKIYNEYITLQTETRREFVDITPRVKSAIEKSGFTEGIVLVGVLHSNAAIIVNDSDICVEPDYLRVVAPLADSKVGLVTCLYRAVGDTFPARFEALGVQFDSPLAGRHGVSNVLAAIACARADGLCTRA